MKYKRLFTLLIALLAVLLVIASLFVRSPWVGYLSWGLMVLSLGVTLVTLIQNDRQRFGGEPSRLRKRILIDTAGLLLSTAAAVLAGLGVIPTGAADAVQPQRLDGAGLPGTQLCGGPGSGNTCPRGMEKGVFVKQ